MLCPGAQIVHFCGHDCVPWDLAVQAVAEKVAELGNGEQLKTVKCFDDMRGSASGTYSSAIYYLMLHRRPVPLHV